jgi:hypothetical protein
MRSSREDALNMMKGLKDDSKFVRLIANVGDFEIAVDGRVSDVSDRLEVRGTEARATIPLPDTVKFEYLEPRDCPPGFEERTFASYWRMIDVAGSCVIAEFIQPPI